MLWFGNHTSADETKQVLKSLQGYGSEIYVHEVGEEKWQITKTVIGDNLFLIFKKKIRL